MTAGHRDPDRQPNPVIVAWGALPPPVHGAAVMNVETREIFEGLAHVVWVDSSSSLGIADIGHATPRKLALDVQSLLKFARTCRANRGATVYVSPALGGLALARDTLALVAARSAPRRIVHIHGGTLPAPRRASPLAAAWRAVLRRSEVWVLGETFRDSIGGVGQSVNVIPNGVSCAQHTSPPRAKVPSVRPHVGFFSNFVKGKGLEVFVETVRPALERDAISVTIAGAGPYEPYNRMADDLVREFPGIRRLASIGPAERCRLMTGLDILMFPSRYLYEGHPLVVCEALEHGAVPIVSDHGSLREAVGDAGLVCRSAADFEAALDRLVTNPSELSQRQRAAVELWVGSYSAEAYRSRVAAAFRSG